MKIQSIKDLIKLDICDAKITSVNVCDNSKKNSIILELDDAVYIEHGSTVYFGPGYIKFFNFIETEFTSYNASKNEKIKLPLSGLASLSIICKQEIIEEKQKIILSGYEKKTNNWLELKINGGQIVGDFKSKQ